MDMYPFCSMIYLLTMLFFPCYKDKEVITCDKDVQIIIITVGFHGHGLTM